MKLLSFIRADGSKSYGIYKDNGIVDLGLRLGDKYKDIKALLAADALSLVSQYAGEQIDYSADTVRFLPIIESPDKILCVGMNYMAKRQEFDETNNAPTLFVRFPESQTGHACGVVKPQVSNEFDYEGELAVIIGKSGTHIRREEALHYVAGYSCYMDGSVRDWQHSWFTAGKNWQETGAFGPWMVTTDEIANPHELDIRTYLNGQMVQNDNTGNMVHSIPELIVYISTSQHYRPVMSLSPVLRVAWVRNGHLLCS